MAPTPPDDRPVEPAAPGPEPTSATAADAGAPRRDRRRLLLLLLPVALVAAAVPAVKVLRGGSDDAEGACGQTLVVAASPDIAPSVDTVLADADPAGCARYDVRPVSSADAARAINDGKAPDIWIPDSSTWVDKIDSRAGSGQWIEGQSIAKSPVVLAVGTTGTFADRTTADSWPEVVNEEGELRMANPDVDTPSRLAFHASRIGEPDAIGLRTGERLIFMSRFAAPSVNKLFGDYLANPEEAPPFPASEQQIFDLASDAPDAPPLRAVMPKDGTLVLDYPWITNPQLTGERLRAAEKGRTAFGRAATRQVLAEAGFRGSDGAGGPPIADAPPARLRELTPLVRDERLDAVKQWDVLRTDMRMLALVDVSGSMRAPSPEAGVSRFEVTQQSLLEGVSIIPAGSEIGGWFFSSDQGPGGRDWRPASPVRRLDEASGKGTGTHRDDLRRVISEGDSFIGGDTGLYDSIWAAYQEMQRTYDPDYVNSITVFTDGENDDPNGGLTLDELLAKIDDAYDPERPVRVITIGMGEADPEALQQIADESGGSSYIAETPEDIKRVFVQALLAR